MILHSTSFDQEDLEHDRKPLIIIHGLFGEGSNWKALAKRLAMHRQVITLDLPNHGHSLHVRLITFELMVNALVETLDSMYIESAHILGHSMGGKVSMLLALQHPRRVASLMAADIAPRTYERKHAKIFEGLQAVTDAKVDSRKEADDILSEYEDNSMIRAFLLKSLLPSASSQSETEGRYRWKFNREGIYRQYDHLRSWVGTISPLQYQGPTLFLRSETGNYFSDEDEATVAGYFPQYRLQCMLGTGHWLHAEKPDEFCTIIQDFIQSIEGEKTHYE